MVIGRGWFGAFYAIVFIVLGTYRIVDNEPSGFSLVLGVVLLIIGVISGAMWIKHWQAARRRRHESR